MQLPDDYEERVYAGWLGKCIGVRFGAPIENWTYDEIQNNLGEITDYFPIEPGKVFKPDDDTAFPMILLRAIEDFGPLVSTAQFGETWLNYLGDERGTLWWGGYGVSTEHTAYVNLKNGIPAPLSGSAKMNGEEVSQQIGGQIFSDIWGLLVPNNPKLAAEYATKASSVAHDKNGIYGGMFIAALVSSAFSENRPERLIKSALAVIPADSAYAGMVESILNYFHEQPGDWHAAYRYIYENFGYDRYPGVVPILPNAAVVVLGLLYGQGDFSRSIQITSMAGWDTDCNVGNVGAIMGVAVGLNGIDDRWRKPINDLLVAASIIGTRNLMDIPACTSLMVTLGKMIAGEELPERRLRYHFSLPGSTHGFLHTGKPLQPEQKILSMSQEFKQDRGVLKVMLRKFKKKDEVRIYVETYLRPERLSANYYGATFSPKIYPGQMMTARFYVPTNTSAHLNASLYVLDNNDQKRHHGQGVSLTPGQWHEIQYEIPPLEGVCLIEAGVVMRNLGEPCTTPIFLDHLDWHGTPHYSFDFTKEQNEQGAISQWTFLRGFWRIEDGSFHGSGAEINEAYTGDIEWRDYTLSVCMIPLLGDFHNILFRVRGALYSYGFGLAKDNHLVLYKNHHGYQPVTSVPFKWQYNEAYVLNIKAESNRFNAWVQDSPILVWEDDDNPYLNGQIGLSNFKGCHTRFDAVSIAPT